MKSRKIALVLMSLLLSATILLSQTIKKIDDDVKKVAQVPKVIE